MDRRTFAQKLTALLVATGVFGSARRTARATPPDYSPAEHNYGMGIDTDKCIGCGRCMEACKDENNVPRNPYFYRTWVERYVVRMNGEVAVQTIDRLDLEGADRVAEKDILRAFFVPKLCNQCDNPPCVQVCPVGATFKTEDGAILVDGERCIGCRYCIQACPYGARYLHPDTEIADKCTFCYHRITRGMLPACVEVCPTQARVFGDHRKSASPLVRFKRMNKTDVLKPYLNTEPKVIYANLDGEVR